MASVSNPPPARPPVRLFKPLTLLAILGVSALLVWHYVFPFYLHYNPVEFSRYWTRRGWFLLHSTFGSVAILAGPLQFSSRLRRRHIKLHRISGRAYLIGIAGASVGSFYLVFTGKRAWNFEFALFVLTCAWLTTAAMAFYAILHRQIQVHKEWMIRSYILTFTFGIFHIAFHILMNYTTIGNHQNPDITMGTLTWASWVIPLLIAEVLLQLNHMRVPARISAARKRAS